MSSSRNLRPPPDRFFGPLDRATTRPRFQSNSNIIQPKKLLIVLNVVEMKSNKDTRYKQTNCRPKYILDRIDICLDFETSLFRDKNLTHMFTLAKRLQILYLKARIRVLYG